MKSNKLSNEAISEFKELCKRKFNIDLDIDLATIYANKVMNDLLKLYHAPVMNEYYATKFKLQQEKFGRNKPTNSVN